MNEPLSFKCNLQGTCCTIMKNDLFPLYPSDILRLAPIHRTTFHFFNQYVGIKFNEKGHFMAHFGTMDLLNDKKPFFPCPFLNRTMKASMCTQYDYRPLFCRLFPYLPPKPKDTSDEIIQWVQPLETWKPFYGVCKGCLEQFAEYTTHRLIEKEFTFDQWLQINRVNKEQVNKEFALLRQLYTEIEKSVVSKHKYAILRIAVVTLHIDLATSLEKGLGQEPNLIENVIEVIQDSRPQTIEQIIEICRKKIKEEEKEIHSEIQSQVTYI